jgi:hypothetical protein
MEKRHIINLQGREFVTYEGLLDEAHARGLRSIRTVLVQVPTEQNGNNAIVQAEVELVENGETKVFTGIGDANPRNVNRNIANHILRMAETRAKARALRDAINVGMTAVEELESADLGREIGEAPRESRSFTVMPSDRPKTPKAAAAEPAEAGPAAGKLASRAQIDQVTREMKRTGFSQDQGRAYLLQNFGKTSRLELTGDEIEQFVQHLKGLPAAEAASS